MTVLKQYNTGSSAWETVVVGGPGPAGLSSMTLAELNTAVTDADVVAGLGTPSICTGVWIGNQAAYDAIGTKISTVLYVIA
jgi:hypothetical protein